MQRAPHKVVLHAGGGRQRRLGVPRADKPAGELAALYVADDTPGGAVRNHFCGAANAGEALRGVAGFVRPFSPPEIAPHAQKRRGRKRVLHAAFEGARGDAPGGEAAGRDAGKGCALGAGALSGNA